MRRAYPPEYDQEPPDLVTCRYCPCDYGVETRCDECPECYDSR